MILQVILLLVSVEYGYGASLLAGRKNYKKIYEYLEEEWIRPQRLPKLVVTMSTTPQRLSRGYLMPVIEAFLTKQFLDPDLVLVVIPKGPMRRKPTEVYPGDDELPPYLTKPPEDWRAGGRLQIERSCLDEGPISHIACAMRIDLPQDALVVVAADDVIPSPHHLAILSYNSLLSKGSAISSMGLNSRQGFRPCQVSDFANGCLGRRYFGSTFGPLTIGWMGTVVRPWFFGPEGLPLPPAIDAKTQGGLQNCRMHDDMWLGAMLALKGIRRESINAGLAAGSKPVETSQLWHFFNLATLPVARTMEGLNLKVKIATQLPAFLVSKYRRSRIAVIKSPASGGLRLFLSPSCDDNDPGNNYLLDLFPEGKLAINGELLENLYTEDDIISLSIESGSVIASVGSKILRIWTANGVAAMCAKLIVYEPVKEGIMELVEISRLAGSLTLKGKNMDYLSACNAALRSFGKGLWTLRTRLVAVEVPPESSRVSTAATAVMLRSSRLWGDLVHCLGHVDQWYRFLTQDDGTGTGHFEMFGNTSAEAMKNLAFELSAALDHEGDHVVVVVLIPLRSTSTLSFEVQKVGDPFIVEMEKSSCVAISSALQCSMANPSSCCVALAARNLGRASSENFLVLSGSLEAWRQLGSEAEKADPSKTSSSTSSSLSVSTLTSSSLLVSAASSERKRCWASSVNASWGSCCGPQVTTMASPEISLPREKLRAKRCASSWTKSKEHPSNCCYVHPSFSMIWKHWGGEWQMTYSDGEKVFFKVSQMGDVLRDKNDGTVAEMQLVELQSDGSATARLTFKTDRKQMPSESHGLEVWRLVEGNIESIISYPDLSFRTGKAYETEHSKLLSVGIA
eukprot:TRINITY_DN23593_c0_g1_i1.p1 TRINITY_DN23593_c0_g1~~TRINITY_DN23593_c0_g1_i1.p1  ORF type:complete len:852 (-),score=121.14 TRINITY_DN23593_c0_g1_i1:23-2578(-)